MSLLHPAKKHCMNAARNQYRHLNRIVSYPPPAAGVNFNFIEKVEHDPSDRVIWHVIHSPEGRFIYDYHLCRARQQRMKRMCLGCRRVEVRGIKRLCNTCANIRKRASNRRSQSKRRSSVSKTGFSSLRAEALTPAVLPSRSTESLLDKMPVSTAP